MNEGTASGNGASLGPRPIATTSSGHRHSRTLSQITTLDIDLANALCVAPAPHSWRDAEERVLSEFGDDFSTSAPTDVGSSSPHNAYFVEDLNASNDSLSSTVSNPTLNEDLHPPSMPSQRSPSPEVFGTVPVHCVRVIEPGSRRNSGESFYAYFIEDGDMVYDPPEEIPVPRPTTADRGRFREVVDSKNFDVNPGAVDTSSVSDQEGAPSPVLGKRHSGDKRKNRISQVIVDASKRSKRRMTSCTIQ